METAAESGNRVEPWAQTLSKAVTQHRKRRSDMKPTMLNVSLMASTALAMVMAMAGCDHDHHDRGRDRDRRPDRERRDYDRHDDHRDYDRHDEDRGGR